MTTVALLFLSYSSICLLLYFRQRQIIYRPSLELSLRPDAPDFGMTYEDVLIPVDEERLWAWWIPADETQQYRVLEEEPAFVLKDSKVMLYFCGVGNNMGDYNYLSRVAAFRQLGFSVLTFDYRGYGRSEGSFPSEQQLYADSEAVWRYLRNERGVLAKDIVLYGESMGGAIALNLAVNHPEAGALIMQSSFTSMTDAIQHRTFARLFPIDRMLTETFDSVGKIHELQIPALFIHGSEDSVVPEEMSQVLYERAAAPKRLWLVPDADHVSIYRADSSYLKAIEAFIEDFDI